MADENVNSQAQTPQEPQDIAQAFQMVRENNQAAAKPAEPEKQSIPDEAGSDGYIDRGQEAQAGTGGIGDQDDGSQVAPEPAVGEGAGTLGGPTAGVETYDYGSLQNNLIASLQMEAQQNVLKKFKENNIQVMDIGDLYERREDGTVVFNNPDNPNRPFESREQAQAWINSMNQQIQNAYNQEVYKEQQNLYELARPSIALIQFAPVYDSMSEAAQNIFDDLIEPYSVRAANGDVIGFNCNLPAMARQALKIVDQYGIGKQTAPAQQQAPKQKTPAMDLKSGSGSSSDEPEPTNIAEAMALLNKRNKEKRNGN